MPASEASTDVAGLWLERFASPRRIRDTGPFHVHAATDVERMTPVAVVTGAPTTDSHEVRRALDELARVHGLFEAPHVPPLLGRARVGEIDYVAFGCHVAATIEGLRRATGSFEVPLISYGTAYGFVHVLLEALRVTHATIDPETGQPICLGALSLANMLVSPEGRIWVIGFGHNLVGSQRGSGRTAHAFTTPRIVAGAGPLPSDDVYGIVAASLSLLSWVELPPALDRIIRGQPEAGDKELAETVNGIFAETIYSPPNQRISSVDEFERRHRRVLELTGQTLNLEAQWAHLAHLVAMASQHSSHPQAVGGGARSGQEWFGGRYVAEKKLGEGAIGTVLLARDRQLRQPVALKLVRKTAQGRSDERFLREVRLLRTVHHKNVLRGFDLFDEDDWLVAVLEYVEGDTLQTFVDANPDNRLALARMLADVAEGLAALHEAGVVHRDVKPANIVINEQRGGILVDLGVARELGATALTQTGGLVGTPAYMSPEQCAGQPAGPPSDVYSLALVLLELLTGTRTLVAGDTEPALAKRVELLASAQLTDALRGLLERALSTAPEERPKASQLAAELRVALASDLDTLSPDALLVGEGARWFRPPHNARIDLGRRRALRRILAALVEHRLAQQPGGLARDALIEAGWPDEQILYEAATNRLHVSLSTLRKLGLRDILELDDEGYRLSPKVSVVAPVPDG